MLNFVKRTWAEINLDNLTHNFRLIRENIDKSCKLCCVIKADGYGHGAVELSKLYKDLGADWFAVSNIEEAMQLRINGSTLPILILGYTPAKYADILSVYNISQAVYSTEYAQALSRYAKKNGVKVKIHLKLDTGMSRIGLICQDEDNLQAVEEGYKICTMENLIPEGVFTHFAVADEAGDGKEFTEKQYNCFINAVDKLTKKGISFKLRHCSNSGAILDYKNLNLDMVRAGVILYGLSPSKKLKGKLQLKPAMELKSVVSYVKDIEKGMTVSYGRTYTAQSKTKIATIPIGYADGYSRHLSGKAQVEVNGKLATVVGKVCMDQIMVDVSDIPETKMGDSVTIFGNGSTSAPTVDDIADLCDTINYEIVCLIGKRVARVYLKDGKVVNTSTLV